MFVYGAALVAQMVRASDS